LFESYLYKNKTKAQVIQDLELEKEREEARIATAKLEGKDISHEIKKKKNVTTNNTTLISINHLNFLILLKYLVFIFVFLASYDRQGTC